MFLFKRVVIPARSKAPICTRKRNPEDSGRSSEMASSCPWPFPSFPLASSLLNSSFYFNPSGTLQSSTVVSYDIMIINMDKKLNLFALRQKSRVWPLQKIGKFCNYRNFKDAYSFLSGDKILCSLYFDSYPSLSHLISRTLSTNVIGYTKNVLCLICEQGLKMEKKQESLYALQALIKRDMLLIANCCTRGIFVNVISSCFV